MNKTVKSQRTFVNKKITELEPLYHSPKNKIHLTKHFNFVKENQSSRKNGIHLYKLDFSRISNKVNNNFNEKNLSHSISTPKIKLKTKINSIIKEFSTYGSNKTNNVINKSNSLYHSRLDLKFTLTNIKHTSNTQNPFWSQEETIQEMKDKYNYSISYTSLKQEDSNKEINKNNFKKLLMRDFGILRDNQYRSKQLYNRENDLLTHLDEIKHDNNNLNKLCRLELDNYYKNRLKKKETSSKRIANEIKEMDCPGYEAITVPLRSSSLGGKINYLNLERKIKVFHIKKYNYDVDNDDLGVKNLSKLKKTLQKISIDSMKSNSKVLPKFIKGKVRNQTIKKYRSLLGMYFGLSE